MSQKKIRDLQRLLRKKELDATATNDIKLKIDELVKNKEAHAVRERERKNAVKYHMVKFFERKKITRKIRRIDADISKTVEPKALKTLRKERRLAEEDLAYVMYYPNTLKYVGLFHDDGSKIEPSLLQQKARTEAISAWKADLNENGESNRVQEAIRVAYEAKRSKKIVSSKNNENLVSNQDETSQSSEDESNVGFSDFQDPSLSAKINDSDSLVIKEPATKLSIKTSERKRNPSTTASKEPQAPLYDADDFFTEEAGTITADSIPEALSSRDNIQFSEGRGFSRGRGGRRNNMARSFRSAEGKELSKQEARLLSWQQGARGRGYRGNKVDRQHSNENNDGARRNTHARSGTESFSGKMGKSRFSSNQRNHESTTSTFFEPNKKIKFNDS